MNELQIKLTADIKDIQSALTKVKKTLKEFEDSASSSTDKTNKKQSNQVGIIQKLNAELSKYKTLITKATSEAEIAKYNAKLQETQKELARLNALGKVFEQRKVVVKEEIGLIGRLNAQVKQLKVSLREATSEEEVARLNAQLEQTSAELARINSLGKTVAVSTAQSFDKFRVSAGAANGSAIAFNRVIQDAPFGIIGVGNNIQQLAEQFSALRITTGSTGTALSAFFKSLFTGSNLLVLGISAATAAFTAYQLGAFDSAEETKDLAKELDDYKNSLDDEYLHVWGPVPRPMYITNTGEGTYLLHIPNVFDDEEFDSIDDALIAAQESWDGRQGEKSFASQLMKHKMNQMR